MARYAGRIKTKEYEVESRGKFRLVYEFGAKVSRLSVFTKKGEQVGYSNCKTDGLAGYSLITTTLDEVGLNGQILTDRDSIRLKLDKRYIENLASAVMRNKSRGSR